jgi:hypothetical protein
MPRTQMEDRFGLLDAVLTPTPISTRRFWGAWKVVYA